MSWNSSRHETEYRLIMAALIGLCALAVVSSIVPIVEHIVGVALIVIGLGCAGFLAVRRELRIRRRIADIDGTRYAPRPGGASQSRVGPGWPRPCSTCPNPPDGGSPARHRPPGRIRWRRSMTGSNHSVPPSVREIAALTAPLRELSGRAAAGVDPAVDAAERATFIADKNDLIARITSGAAYERWAAGPTSPFSLDQSEQQEERREQLGCWHDDDVRDGEFIGDGQELVCDDAPGLP